METELKLLLDPRHIARLRKHVLLKQLVIGKPRLQAVDSTYFDTPDLYLRRHGVSLRVRHVKGEGWVQSLKGNNRSVAGLHQRDEWETPLRAPLPELATLRRLVRQDAHWRRVLARRALGKQLVPLFTTHIKRTLWNLRLPDNGSAELALDQGKLELAAMQTANSTAISEIELELKSGDSIHLFDIALQLQKTLLLQIDSGSKADRGFSILASQPPAVVKASRLELISTMTVEQGLQAIIVNCLQQIDGNRAGVAQGIDPESVHQMRVGLRRLRSALKLFKQYAPLPELLQSEFNWLGAQLSAARDWEVLSNTTLPALALQVQGSADLAALQNAASDIARNMRVAAAKAVSSARYTRLMLTFAKWTAGRQWRDSLNPSQRKALTARIKNFSDKAIGHHHRHLLRSGKNMAKLTPEQRHKTRIAAKKLRYTSEFFAPLYHAGQIKSFIARLSALQDVLGKMNDAKVAGELLRQIAQTHFALSAASGFAYGYLTAQIEGDLSEAQKKWKRFAGKGMPSQRHF